MATPSEEILPQLLSLPASERAKLAEKLLESLKEPQETPEPIISAMRDAMNDELFLSDLWQTMKDFEHVDREVGPK
jgi:hypothetical protein